MPSLALARARPRRQPEWLCCEVVAKQIVQEALAKKHNTTVAHIRDIAREAGLTANYNYINRNWFIDERPAVVNQFTRQLDVFMDDLAA